LNSVAPIRTKNNNNNNNKMISDMGSVPDSKKFDLNNSGKVGRLNKIRKQQYLVVGLVEVSE